MTLTEILAESRRLVKGSSTSFSTADIITSANAALERAVALIRQAEGRWQWDDSNQTDFPVATTNLVLGQQDYTLDSNHYRIERVEVKDDAGNWHKLIPFDGSDLKDQSLTDFLADSGLPQYYDKIGSSLKLYPAPDYSQNASLKVFYERGPVYFSSGDLDQAPGFNPLFHRLIPLWAAYDYAMINNLKNTDRLRGEINVIESELQEYYSLRDKDEHIRLSVGKYNFK